ncbi:MAG: 50S ribosomal protein L17 [Bacteriovoracales bacterium]|nr:50S ribosomal protein L17 [Bacteriovoracales bacterium]
MRHRKHRNKLAVNPAHRKSLIRNLCVSLIDHNSIRTTHAKAKAVQPFLEKLVTLAKKDSVANRRLAESRLNSSRAVKKLFSHVAPQFKTRNGGYTRIVKSAEGRVGDNAKMSTIEFVEQA